MGSETIITQCPHCIALFKVTPGQLKIADGQVRCGNCLHVFSALDNIPREDTPNHKTSTEIEKRHPVSPIPEDDILHQASHSKPLKIAKKNKSKKETTSADLSKARNTHSRPIQEVTQTEKDIPTLTIQRERIILSHTKIEPHQRSLVWSFLLIITLGGLASQYIWFNRATLYWVEHYQPLYHTLCQHIECKLPQRFNLEKLTNQQLTVSPHPEIEGAITVNLTLHNSADFEQPYPAFALHFSDLKGRPVANRLFQPNQYFIPSTEGASTEAFKENTDRLIPINKTTTISIELMSPGTRALSYRAELIAPEL
ncbi:MULTISPECIES: DUF3426 domain-containing protein [unclassified Neptuniibacter]|uniref:DUF3426 domain-containing protein n=1 Tax=unclassified Neptuniibacter TaxID=2630693 RepID=UPI000C4D7AB8|nr:MULTISPECIES: DUF3426 domain-containing protein [unclassified Neptuniibacter]MAY41608.1 hypothetical protein [Oceanospirillaceae bacterium]|tara:strand:- start:2022 stop:2957 length:936 start_codon:yes stop_codon:yes gene_type:complete